MHWCVCPVRVIADTSIGHTESWSGSPPLHLKPRICYG